MRVLILGGTQFLGRHLVDAALEGGHEVTLFNRGQTNPELYFEVEKLRGDRDGGLNALRGRNWDAVIDTSGHVPRLVNQSVELLRDAVGHYTFVSSISVYADFSHVGIDENAPVGTLNDETTENVSEYFGALKALCEQRVQSGFGNRGLIVRPGLIVGPHDPTDRFTYWVRRFSRGGEVLVPESSHASIQFIDVRDLAQWMMRCIEGDVTGVYNATGPDYKLTMGGFAEELERIIPNAGRAHWVSEEFLLAKGVREFSELPLWISERTNWPGFMTVDVQRAIRQGLSFRPLEQTILDTLGWDQTRQLGQQSTRLHAVRDVGMSSEREIRLLQEWKMHPSYGT